ncbi:type II toxin-antitoxin system RelE family toxin [Asticcacaulis benevestitus]|uniref:RelE/StbE family addiction module toxin n=1 Tax=Asticcacaulis benevestitus DSM 16100 = ATCC BAA-896 TaxID=1121022 RepID=V4P795_9CAUL|nr:type II toxin-antitoxin system RelE/ParE family toxin [Asticcacaulis benevestitus]ESQ82984.1 RelE/StbE family addiction module toxin [Asticcacaulis benevestitus DSM 16100 = ATCC BAA-896]
MYEVMTTKHFDKRLAGLPVNLQKRIVGKILEVAADPYAPNNNLKKLQGTQGYRLRVGDWRIIYELQDERLVMLVLEIDSRGGIYK